MTGSKVVVTVKAKQGLEGRMVIMGRRGASLPNWTRHQIGLGGNMGEVQIGTGHTKGLQGREGTLSPLAKKTSLMGESFPILSETFSGSGCSSTRDWTLTISRQPRISWQDKSTVGLFSRVRETGSIYPTRVKEGHETTSQRPITT